MKMREEKSCASGTSPGFLRIEERERVAKLSVGISLGIISMVIIVWLAWYYAGLRPKEMFTLPCTECEGISFGESGLALEEAVHQICLAHGEKDGYVFALRGKRAVRFVPNEFHSVYGRLERVPAEEDTVYFYRYRARNMPMIFP